MTQPSIVLLVHLVTSRTATDLVYQLVAPDNILIPSRMFVRNVVLLACSAFQLIYALVAIILQSTLISLVTVALLHVPTATLPIPTTHANSVPVAAFTVPKPMIIVLNAMEITTS
jgi:hypothetical protein